MGYRLPCHRFESSLSVGLADAIKEGKKYGFTFAPEAATERLRKVINKVIPDDRLLDTADAVYARGWQTIKLYFMIGLPTETDEDVVAICNLAKRVLHVGRKYSRQGRVRPRWRLNVCAETAYTLSVGGAGTTRRGGTPARDIAPRIAHARFEAELERL